MPDPMDQKLAEMGEQMRGYLIEAQGVQIDALGQMWLELARELAATGALDTEQLAQRLEAHAKRVPDMTHWFYDLMDAARRLRQQASGDDSSLVQ